MAPRFLLLYPPLQFGLKEMAKPDGSLGLPYLAGALRRAGFEVDILDLSVGGRDDDLDDTFRRPVELPSGLYRVGLSPERMLQAVAPWDVVGITSIFTPQTSMVLDTVRRIKQAFPDKLILAGGVNARSLQSRFFDAGVDVICLSESEGTIVEIARTLARGSHDLSAVPGLAFRAGGGIFATPPPRVVSDLDELAMPAWDLLPNEKYWAISRPHGGDFPPGETIRYAEVMTSRGCPFRCTYCHISKEGEGSASGPLAGLRLKSHDRVVAEFAALKALGAEHIFIEDDSLLAKKDRIIKIFRALRGMGLKLADVNGVNIVHLFRNRGGKLEVDRELIDVMVEVGFESLSLPFESANQRILDRYASSKWRMDRLDTMALVKACREAGLRDVHGNYMIGYPDETREEAERTIDFARRHMDAGMSYALFFAVVPYPGSQLFDEALRRGHIDADFDPDGFRWTNPIMRDTVVPSEVLSEIRQQAWLSVNRPEWVKYKLGMTVESLRTD